jgi:hypothetical protein
MTLDIPEILIILLSVMLLILWINDRYPRHRSLRHHKGHRKI